MADSKAVPLNVQVKNQCGICAKASPDLLSRSVPHEKDKCCLRCRDFSQADKRATADSLKIANLKTGGRGLLKEGDQASWAKIVAQQLTDGVAADVDKA